MDDTDRARALDRFERLGRDRVKLYSAIDCDRYLGDWQVRELADAWLEAKDSEARSVAGFWDWLLKGRR